MVVQKGEMNSGFVHRSAVEGYVQSLLMKRALDKLKTPTGVLKSMAVCELQDAGNWGDDVRVDVRLSVEHRTARCQRLLHGIPSPRYWYKQGMFWMAAIDVIYFFAENSPQRHTLLQDALPKLETLQQLESWLTSFSSRRFHRDLVESLLTHAECKLSEPSYAKHLLPSVALEHTAIDAAEIDRYAWARGYGAINLAKAAPVWSPPAPRTVFKRSMT